MRSTFLLYKTAIDWKGQAPLQSMAVQQLYRIPPSVFDIPVDGRLLLLIRPVVNP